MLSKKVLMIAPTPFFSDRGCHIRVLNSYLRLKREGKEVLLITYPLGRDINDVQAKRIIKIPTYKDFSPGFNIHKPLLDILLLAKAFKELNKKEYDFIYAHLHEGALIGLLVKPFFRLPIFFDAQGSLTGELVTNKTIKKNSLMFKLLFKIEEFIVNKVDKIYTSTEGLKEFIESDFKPKNKIKVIKDLPDKTLFNPNVKPADINLPKNKKIVVYLGGLQKNKGIDYLLKAIPYCSNKLHFLIMGYPVNRAKKLINKLKIEDRVTLTGRIPYEIAPSYLKLGDVAVSPKTLESGEANAKLYNYLAMGLQVVCWDISENRKILAERGIYAKLKDVKDLAKKINII
jgi:glycosyltransferase involved in cell wall biosynthesis